MSESCLNAQLGGRRERERDSKALSRVCAPARGARSPRGARQEGSARPRGARAPASRALVGSRVSKRRAPGGRPQARRAQHRSCALAEFCLPRARVAVCVCQREKAHRKAGWESREARREGGSAELQPGPPCGCTSRLLKTKHVLKAVFCASGRFLQPQFPPLGLAATDCKRNSLGDSEGWGVNTGLDHLFLLARTCRWRRAVISALGVQAD